MRRLLQVQPNSGLRLLYRKGYHAPGIRSFSAIHQDDDIDHGDSDNQEEPMYKRKYNSPFLVPTWSFGSNRDPSHGPTVSKSVFVAEQETNNLTSPTTATIESEKENISEGDVEKCVHSQSGWDTEEHSGIKDKKEGKEDAERSQFQHTSRTITTSFLDHGCSTSSPPNTKVKDHTSWHFLSPALLARDRWIDKTPRQKLKPVPAPVVAISPHRDICEYNGWTKEVSHL